MPNHVTTICTVTGPDAEVSRFRAEMIRTEKNEHKEWTLLDFNAAIPMPESLKNAAASSTAENAAVLIQLRADRGAPFATGGLYDAQIEMIRKDVGMMRDNISEVAKAYLAKHPDQEAEGMLRLRNITDHGYANWYPWSIEKWGTKWNSYSFSVKSEQPFTIQFNTAWSFPEPVFHKIAELFPTLKFEIVSFDEGWNFACEGCFNGEPPFQRVKATDELYERVYGEKPNHDEEDAA